MTELREKFRSPFTTKHTQTIKHNHTTSKISQLKHPYIRAEKFFEYFEKQTVDKMDNAFTLEKLPPEITLEIAQFMDPIDLYICQNISRYK